MENTALLELVTEHLRDIYDAEKQLTRALPKLAKAASDPELSKGFKDHLAQTQGQVKRLEQAFQALGKKVRGKPCAGMKGLIEEGQEAITSHEGEARDLSICAGARKVEHYEMVAYEAVISAAQTAKQTDVVELLKETLREESETDKHLAAIAKRLFKESTRKAPAEPEAAAPRRGKATPATNSSRKAAASRADSQKNNSRRSRNTHTGANSESHGSHTTTDPEEIRQWAEARGGQPACVMGTGGKGDIGLLRLEFPGAPNANDSKLTPISWEDFFEKFEEHGLALVYQDETAEGEKSNFNKLVSREPETAGASGARSRSSR